MHTLYSSCQLGVGGELLFQMALGDVFCESEHMLLTLELKSVFHVAVSVLKISS